MPHSHLASFIFAVLTPCAFSACSDQSPAAPDATPDGVQYATTLAQPVLGSYTLTFFFDAFNIITLQAHVTDDLGNPAQSGVVIFQYCSYKGFPRYDVTRIDEAPISACADGSAKWVTLATVPVNASGDAFVEVGPVNIVDVIGFRFRYVGQGSGIANYTINPVNWYR
jgi:hypothetical protein